MKNTIIAAASLMVLTLLIAVTMPACADTSSPSPPPANPSSPAAQPTEYAAETEKAVSTVYWDVTGDGAKEELYLYNDEQPHISAFIDGAEYRVTVQPRRWEGTAYIEGGADGIIAVFCKNEAQLLSLYKWDAGSKSFVSLPVPKNGGEGEWYGGYGLPSDSERELGAITRIDNLRDALRVYQPTDGGLLVTTFVADEASYTVKHQELQKEEG
ncbi:hypothetical protein FACS189425_08730 [Clostridia bacterium]|nr:hypothetical protein FACS189425_08730 [Clostridia bacterium]